MADSIADVTGVVENNNTVNNDNGVEEINETDEETDNNDNDEDSPSEERPHTEDNDGGNDDPPSDHQGPSQGPSEAPSPPNPGTPRLPNLAQQAIQRLHAIEKRKEDSPDDFRPVKKRRINNTKTDNLDDSVDEGQCCSICLEPWSNSGIHRIASLKCGHLFGYGCIEKWLKTNDGRCPQCNSTAKKKEIRVIFAKTISVVDTTERDRALKDLEDEKSARIAAQKSEAQAILQYQLAKVECERVKQQLKQVQTQLDNYMAKSNGHSAEEGGVASDVPTVPSGADGNGQFTLLKTININGNSRVMSHDSQSGMIVASKKSSNQLYRGYGLIKISLLDLKPSEFVPIHEKPIRDIVFSPRGDELTLTTAQAERQLKLTSMHSNTVVQSYSLPCPSWACSWNLDDPNYMYCGLSNGSLMTFDLRQTSSHVAEHKIPNRSCVPVTSLAYVPICRTSHLNCSGILMGTLDGTVFWEMDQDSVKPHIIDSLSGPCMDVSFEPLSRHCLASFRPSKNNIKSRHTICQLQNTPLTQPFTCNPLHQFEGGKVQKALTRSLLFQKPSSPGNLMVAYGNEEYHQVHLCDFSTMSEVQVLKTKDEACLDISIINGKSTDTPTLLNLLTDSKLYVYSWT